MRIRVLILFCLLLNHLLPAQTLTAHVSGIRSGAGNIRLQVFTSAENFDGEKPLLIKTYPKTGLAGGQLQLELTGLKPGTYGVAILDDENSNQKMDYGLVLPKEGFGFSDYYHTGMSRPKFERFDFTIGNEKKNVQIRLRYL